MAKEQGISLYRCDRCAAAEYIKDGDPKADGWKTIKRVTADGSTIERFLCESCILQYKPITESQDASFNKFMLGK